MRLARVWERRNVCSQDGGLCEQKRALCPLLVDILFDQETFHAVECEQAEKECHWALIRVRTRPWAN